jgi:hypothetical protein
MANKTNGEAPEYREARAHHAPDSVPGIMATQAVRTGRVRYILTISLALVIVLMVIVFLIVRPG